MKLLSFPIVMLTLTLVRGQFLNDFNYYDEYNTVSDHQLPQQEAIKVLSNHDVVYSDPPVVRDYKSSSYFNPRGMHYVYDITHVIFDLVQRENVFPASLNKTEVIETFPEETPQLLESHWEDFMLQYIGVITVATCGFLLALAMPIACVCMCCCRCRGKCGATAEHYDKKSDACKRFFTGVLLAGLVIASMFGLVCAFVTTFHFYDGIQKLPSRLEDSSEDTSRYLENTKIEVQTLLVTNFNELEEVLNEVLDESGTILKKSLAQVTKAAAIDDLTDIVSNLGNVRRYLKDIQNKTMVLQDKVGQLSLGLNGTSNRLLNALDKCNSISICRDFLEEYNITRDLAIAASFDQHSTSLPDVTFLMKDIAKLMSNDIERKVKVGQKQLDKVKVDIERSITDIRPKVKTEIRKMGKELAQQSDTIQTFLDEMKTQVSSAKKEIPKITPHAEYYGEYLFYIGLGMACMLMLILTCYVFGLFYGFCGKRPGIYGTDDCCNTGTGSRWLLAAVYLTFIFSCVLLVIATVQFLVGSMVDKVVCQAVQRPNDSDVFHLIDEQYLQPFLHEQRPNEDWHASFTEIVDECHSNRTAYEVLNIKAVYDVEDLRKWRRRYGIGEFIERLKERIRLDDLRGIQILSPEAEAELIELANSHLSNLNFSKYTELLREQITNIDLSIFTSRLRQLRERLSRQQARAIGPALDNEALFLDQMQKVVMDMKLAMKDLDNSVKALEAEARLAKPNLSQALKDLVTQATKATQFLREEGPQLVDELANQYVNETVGLIDGYVSRVINSTYESIGRCEPLSNSYNATVIAGCNYIVDPFNGVWTSVFWCLMFFIPSLPLALSLVALYRKSEPYSDPLVEQVPPPSNRGDARDKKKGRGGRGHRRNPSEYLPDSAHYRAGYSYQDRRNRFQDMAPALMHSNSSPATANTEGGASGVPPPNGPPRYSSNPDLAAASTAPGSGSATAASAAPPPIEYERPPPYYFPGAGPAVGDVPPPLPAPNRPS